MLARREFFLHHVNDGRFEVVVDILYFKFVSGGVVRHSYFKVSSLVHQCAILSIIECDSDFAEIKQVALTVDCPLDDMC